MARRKICVLVNGGQPKDGTGQVCIHLFVQDESGPFVEPHALHLAHADEEKQPVGTVGKELVARPTRGRLACDPRRLVAPVVRGGVTTITPRTDDPRAVTCPKCIESPEYAEMVQTPTVGQPTGQ